MERNVIISLVAGYITSLLPVWTWDSRVELVTATIILSTAWLLILIWIQELTRRIKKALTLADVRAGKQ